MSRPVHIFEKQIAIEFGLAGAVILENLIYLQEAHRIAGDEGFYFEGRWWVRHTPDTLAAWHGYFTRDQARRALEKLIQQGAIVKSTDPAKPRDRGSFWSVNQTIINRKSDRANLPNALGEISKDAANLPNVLHKDNINTNLSKGRRTKKPNPPDSLDTVRAYCVEKNLEVDAIDFWNYYTAGDNPWHDAKGNPVLNWKQKLLTWNSHQPKRRQVNRDGVKSTRDISIREQLNDTSWAN